MAEPANGRKPLSSSSLDNDSMSWTLRVYAGNGQWSEHRIHDKNEAEQAYERQVRFMPNCPAELTENRLVMSHLT